jgi:vancomycin resistance protein VanW
VNRKLLSQYHPALYFFAVWLYRYRRYMRWYFSRTRYARRRNDTSLPYRVKKHESILVRRLGDSDYQLQVNKITNLRIALKNINGLIIRPGETFSFCKLVGLPSKRKGYLPGMELSNGEARVGIGGGICQLSNLLHWLVLHSPMTVVERRHHSFDPFPDDGRVLPFASGATVFYNYIDFQFKNTTDNTFQILLWLGDKHLHGEIRSSETLAHTYFVYEDKHEFLQVSDKYYRRNEIWRRVHKRQGGELVARELMVKNFAEVKYRPESFREIDG